MRPPLIPTRLRRHAPLIATGVAAATAIAALARGGRVAPTLESVVFLAALMVVLGVAVAAFASKLFMRRLSSMADCMQDSVSCLSRANGTCARISEPGDPRLDAIAGAFNALLARVETHNVTIGLHENMEMGLNEWIKAWRSHEAELSKAKALAEAASRTKSRFLANVSHELRTPLQTIMSFARFGQRDAAKGKFDEAGEFFETIHDSGDYLLLLLNDLLDLSKLESDKFSLSIAPTKLSDVVGAVVDEFQAVQRERNLAISLTEGADHDVVMIDGPRVMQAVRNVLANAVKFSPDGGAITVRIVVGSDNVTLSVTDEGTGVPEDELDAIFEEFTKSRTAQHMEGTGLGLAITRQIVAAHKGSIWAENAQDRGLTVFIQLPAQPEPVPA